MKKHPLSLTLCAALTVGAVTLFGQAPGSSPAGSPPPGAPPPPPGHHGPPPSPLFRALDTNKDGAISADEIANAPAALKTLAGDSGQITRESLRPPHREGEDPRPKDEATHPHRPRPDADGSQAPHPQRPPPPGTEPGDPRRPDASPAPDASPVGSGDRSPQELGRPPHHGPPPNDGLFDALDTNGDGTISTDEIAAAATALKKADTNGDGVIDRRDFRLPPPPPPPAAN